MAASDFRRDALVMGSDNLPFAPFVSPLTDQQHAQIGRIAILWGYADFLLDMILEKAIGLTRDQHDALVRDKSFSAKLDILKAFLPRIADDDARGHAEKFRAGLNATKQRRNQAFHGAWGWRSIKGQSEPVICARHHVMRNNPVRPSDLPKLEAELCDALNFGQSSMVKLHLLPQPLGPNRFLHGEGEAPPPEFLQWQEQHPLDDANLDRSCKEGELLRLVDPMR